LQQEINQKSHFQNLKGELKKQKLYEKVLLDKCNLVKKQQIAQRTKQTKIIQNETSQIYERINKKKQLGKKMQDEFKIIVNENNTEVKQIDGNLNDLKEL